MKKTSLNNKNSIKKDYKEYRSLEYAIGDLKQSIDKNVNKHIFTINDLIILTKGTQVMKDTESHRSR